MELLIQEVTKKSDIKNFVDFQFQLYNGNKYWVPPVKIDEQKILMPEHNPMFDFCDAKFWLAKRGKKIVGRIGAIINHKHNQKTGEKAGRFSRLEFIDDHQVCKMLLETAENWILDQGMDIIYGPLGFSNLDHQGMLIEGFDHLPSVASEYHQPYYKEHIEKLGYTKEIDWIEFRLTIGDIPEKALKLNELIKQRYGLRVLHFKKSGQLKPYAPQVFEVLNKAFSELFSVVEMNEKMVDYYTNRYFSLLNPHFVKAVLNKEDQMVGFIIGLPSLSEAMQKANGKLFPFGFFHIMKALKKPKVMDLLLTGIDPKMQGQGVSALLITELQKVMLDYGVQYTETTGIFETNQKAIQHWKNYEHIQHKRKRCFRKKLK
jgi:GNAT superfamily N-acetyltransferase